ncbi:hypothetical protein [Nocardioides sp.]|uniref:hypothetical protein n=1 Tax=Nocardioides sp. TaxID=35761 RepID=UPI0035179B33
MSAATSPRRPRRLPRARVSGGLALVLAAALLAGPNAAPAPAAAAAPLVAPLPDAVDVGQTLTVRGRATAGTTVAVQTRQGGAWRTAARATASGSGAFRAAVRFTAGGPAQVRAVVGDRASNTQRLAVYGWLDLATQPILVGSAAYVDVPATIGGASFPHSLLVQGGSASVWWRVDRQCTEVRYTLGLEDTEFPRSDGDEEVVSRVYALDEGVGSASGEVVAGWYTASPVTLRGLAQAERLVITGTLRDLDADGLSIVIGTPRARCNAARLGPVSRSDTHVP